MAADLTDRQREVLALMVEGDTNAEIARALWLSSDTVRYHVARICGALGARNRTHAVAPSLRGDAAVAAILIDSIADELHARAVAMAKGSEEAQRVSA